MINDEHKLYSKIIIDNALDTSNDIYQEILKNLEERNYENVLVQIKNMQSSNKQDLIHDANLYLYLLNLATDNLVISNKIKDTEFKSIKVFPDNKNYDAYVENNIRSAIIRRKFPYALKQLNDYISKIGKLEVPHEVTKKLLITILDKERKEQKEIYYLASTKHYKIALDILNQKDKRKGLSSPEICISDLLESLINVKETKQIPIIIEEYADNIYDAILNNNYDLADQINRNHYKKYGCKTDSEKTINYLLFEIRKAIEDLKEKIKFLRPQEVNIQNIEDTIVQIKNYLAAINKEKYLPIIMKQIKLEFLEEEKTFTKTNKLLEQIEKDEVAANISSYEMDFYINLALNKFEIATLYLEIIKEGCRLSKTPMDIEKLERILTKEKRKFSYNELDSNGFTRIRGI